MEDADKRREYIQNGNGKIFVGKYNNMSVFNWEYIQVRKCVGMSVQCLRQPSVYRCMHLANMMFVFLSITNLLTYLPSVYW